ncbi:MAG TPA: sigma-70 family RNA polymerase sigma factor [Polyangiales bacterium]|nr:sigma-70 family RNA polymerase sigma factor [Polyangiales bacterium]
MRSFTLDPQTEQHLSELMRRAQQGERSAYAALLHQAARLVRGFVRRRVREEDVEDIVQDTLLAIHHHRHTFDPSRPFSPWMYAIARHRMLDALRRRKSRAAREVLGEVDVEHCEASEAANSLRAVLETALAQLSHAQREVIQLLKLEGYSVREISDKTGRSESLVKVTAHRGYHVLRKVIGHAFQDE